MTDEEKQEKLKKRREAYQQNKIIKEAKICSMTSKESVAVMNPAYIASEQEGGTSTLNVRQRKHVTKGERQKFLHRQNEEFSVKQRKPRSVSSQEGAAVMNSDSPGIEPLKHPKVMINGNILNFI